MGLAISEGVSVDSAGNIPKGESQALITGQKEQRGIKREEVSQCSLKLKEEKFLLVL